MKVFFVSLIVIIIGLIIWFIPRSNLSKITSPTSSNLSQISVQQSPVVTSSSIVIPKSYTIPQKKQVFQTFNNCGPASLSMLLSYYNIDVSQQQLGEFLRPYQNPQGDNDDKSVFFPEMAQAAEEYGLITYMRPNGDIDLLKALISQDIPVIVRTWLHDNEDIGHYRLIRGYDDSTQEIIQDDSYEGGNLRFSYDKFNRLWQPFNYDYLLIVPQNKQAVVEAILKDQLDEKVAWQKANNRAKKENQTNNFYPIFNQSVSYYYLGEYQKSIEAFESIQSQLPSRMLWYQTEPIKAYLALKQYDKVMTMTDQILFRNNLAYSELYLLRGQVYKEQGKLDLAKQEFIKALKYNKNLKEAQEANASI